jgi:hypothetical protein
MHFKKSEPWSAGENPLTAANFIINGTNQQLGWQSDSGSSGLLLPGECASFDFSSNQHLTITLFSGKSCIVSDWDDNCAIGNKINVSFGSYKLLGPQLVAINKTTGNIELITLNSCPSQGYNQLCTDMLFVGDAIKAALGGCTLPADVANFAPVTNATIQQIAQFLINNRLSYENLCPTNSLPGSGYSCTKGSIPNLQNYLQDNSAYVYNNGDYKFIVGNDPISAANIAWQQIDSDSNAQFLTLGSMTMTDILSTWLPTPVYPTSIGPPIVAGCYCKTTQDGTTKNQQLSSPQLTTAQTWTDIIASAVASALSNEIIDDS